MQTHAIKALLNDAVTLDTAVEIKGWIRTARHSKGGFSFLVVHDGSCFDGIQVVANNELDNYEELLKLFTGCSVIVQGKLVESGGKGQKYEIHAEHVQVVGWVENPDTYPVQPKRHTMEFLTHIGKGTTASHVALAKRLTRDDGASQPNHQGRARLQGRAIGPGSQGST